MWLERLLFVFQLNHWSSCSWAQETLIRKSLTCKSASIHASTRLLFCQATSQGDLTATSRVTWDSEDLNEVKKITDGVEGWLAQAEGELLYKFAKKCSGRGVIVEIGSWKGKSTIWLARGSRAGNRIKIYAVDPHVGAPVNQHTSTLADFNRNLQNAGISELVVPLVMTSIEAARTFAHAVEFIFVDGDHKYESVKLDFELWFPKLVKDGYMAFHDSNHRTGVNFGFGGPKKVVEECLFKSYCFSDLSIVNSIAFGRKVERNSFSDRTIGASLMILNKIRAFANQYGATGAKPLSSFIWLIRKRSSDN
jgi:predicted O-methyltransferase YrrM